MKKNMIVIGAGQGLGNHLLQGINGFQTKYAVSRSGNFQIENVINITCDAADIDGELVDQFDKNSVSLVVYTPSSWGESGGLTMDEYDEFMRTGPRNMLGCFHSLHDRGLLTEDAMFIGIGSIASEKASMTMSGDSNPMYSIAKLVQKSILSQLARFYKYRFATITLGSINDFKGKRGVGYENVVKAIEYLYNHSKIPYTEIDLVSQLDAT